MQHRAHDFTGRARRDHIDDASRDAGFLQDRHQRQHGERRVGGGLEHDRTAGCERRADFPRRHRGGEIPWRHQYGDAGRLVLHEDARARRRAQRVGADVAYRLFGVPAEELGRIGDLAAQIRQRLAVLDGDQLRQTLGVAHDQLVGLAQDLGALARLLLGPGGKRRAGCIECRDRVIDRGAGDRRDLVLGRRVYHVETSAVRRFLPLATDPQVGRHVGEQIVVHGHDAGSRTGSRAPEVARYYSAVNIHLAFREVPALLEGRDDCRNWVDYIG